MTVTRPSAPPRFTWDNLHVGDNLGRVEGVVDESAVRAHAFAIGDDPQRYLGGIGASGPIVPPSLLVNDLLKLFLLGYDCTPPWPGGLHTRAQIEYLRPVSLDETVVITGSHVAKYVKRGRRYRSCLSQAALSDGTVVARMLATETVGYDISTEQDSGMVPDDWASDFPRVEGVIPADAPRAIPGQPLGEGTVLGPLVRDISLEQSVVFSGYPFGWAKESSEALRQGLHTNPDIARTAGFSAPVAQGLLSASQLTALLLDQFGENVMHGSRLSLSFVSPVIVGTSLSSLALTQPTVEINDTPHSSVQLSSRNSQGSLVTVGYAQVPQRW